LHVQEAYAVLIDPEQRAIYHAVGLSPVRYRFGTTGGATNPVALYENLYENLALASTADKTRLVLVWVEGGMVPHSFMHGVVGGNCQ